MIKKACFYYLFVFLTLSAFSTELTGKYYSEDGYIVFNESSYTFFTIDMMTGEQNSISGHFRTKNDEYGNNIVILYDFLSENLSLRYFTFDDFLLLYHDKNRPWFMGNRISSRKLETLISTSISATSFLTEGKRQYLPDKLSYWGNLDYVWSEGNKESGIGDKLFIENNAIKTLYILPGYVSIMRPDLYFKNNRPKTIKITSGSYKNSFILNDEPVFQSINIDIPESEKTIIVEITDVYNGSLYNDTCISSILCLK